jgi:signal transduction histidine kinase
MVLSAALSILLAYVLGARIVGRPVRQLAEKAREVGRGVLAPPLVIAQKDELGFLAQELNAMCESLSRAQEQAQSEARARESALQQLRHADRLATAGKLAAGVAHELGTPLNVVSGRAKMIQKGEVVDEEAQDSARIIVEQATRMTVIIRQLLDFARQEPAGKVRSDLRAVAEESCALLQPTAARSGISLRIGESSEEVTATFAFNQMLQALMNLIVNAVQASSSGTTVTLETRVVEVTPPVEHGGSAGRWACVSVRDQGLGMSPEIAARAFDPFFTTKGVGEGTGLGLSVSYGIVRDSGGWIAMETCPGKGSKFTVYLPI